jgi:predicted dinucleotide-binding enzyme
MSYAIIGFGNIGQALAKAFARNGIEVSVATKRDPESFESAAAAIGPTRLSMTTSFGSHLKRLLIRPIPMTMPTPTRAAVTSRALHTEAR